MNATNRVLNRALLFIVGIMLAAVGAAAMLTAVRPPWAQAAVAAIAEWVDKAGSALASWGLDLSGATVTLTAAWIALGVILVLLILLIVFIATRGGGKTTTVLQVDAEDGTARVDRNVADAVLAGTLRRRPDVLSAHTSSYRVKGKPAIKLTVATRQNTPLPRILQATEDAVADWDALAGSEIPVVLHLTGRSRLEQWRSATRVQ